MNKAAHNPIGEGDYISYSATQKTQAARTQCGNTNPSA